MRDINSLKDNEVIEIKTAKEAKAIRKQCGFHKMPCVPVYCGKNNVGFWWGDKPLSFTGNFLPASDFLPKKKKKSDLKRRLKSAELVLQALIQSLPPSSLNFTLKDLQDLDERNCKGISLKEILKQTTCPGTIPVTDPQVLSDTTNELEVGENWLPVYNYEGLYEISDLGRVKSLERMAKHSVGKGLKVIREKILCLNKNPDGYLKVRLSKDGIKKTKLVHHMVAESFLKHTNRNKYVCVDHIDEDKENNCLSNIQIISKQENTLKSYKNSENNRHIIPNKWYKYRNSIFYYRDDKSCYGIKNGVWSESFKWSRVFGLTPAANEEVQQALIDESKKRYTIFNKINYLDSGEGDLDGFSFMYNSAHNTLCATFDTSDILFKHGNWAEIIKQTDN